MLESDRASFISRCINLELVIRHVKLGSRKLQANLIKNNKVVAVYNPDKGPWYSGDFLELESKWIRGLYQQMKDLGMIHGNYS